MNYTKLLQNYIKLPLTINVNITDLFNNSEHQYYVEDLNTDLFEILKIFNINFYKNKLIQSIHIDKDNIHVNTEKLKLYIFKYFQISEENNVNLCLNNLLKNLDSTMDIKKMHKNIQTEYNNFLPKTYVLPSQTKKYNKIKKQQFSILMRKKINLFIDFLNNEDKYSTLNDIFDENAVQLQLALNVLEYAEECKKKNDKNGFLYTQTYLNNFLNIFDITSATKSQLKKMQFILEAVNKNKPANINNNKYNYSFFEAKNITKENFLETIYRCSSSYDNTDELKQILERKLNFYSNIDYVNLKIGVDSFSGYVGFELTNEYVILERFFENVSDGKIAKDNAIYIVKNIDFLTITKCSKTEAINMINSNKINAIRLIHKGDYEKKISQYTI